jgi:hypothetical protein
MEWHPDKFETEEEKKVAEKKFMDIAAAKEVLSDPDKYVCCSYEKNDIVSRWYVPVLFFSDAPARVRSVLHPCSYPPRALGLSCAYPP